MNTHAGDPGFGSLRRFAQIDFGTNTDPFCVQPCNLGSEGIGVIGVDEVHGASAKAAASHARAVDAGAGRSEVDKQIKLPATYFVVIAQAGMGAIKQVAEKTDVLRVQRIDGSKDSLIFGDDVAAAAINDGGKSMAELFQVRRCERLAGNEHVEEASEIL